jgi:TetR/AcrR family transcriptional regulator, copper-responsive repressor
MNGTPARPRGRPRSFDRDAALERAMEVFWKHGFEGASLSDLTEAMGINPPSLYAAFGDKEHLFLEAVERYQEKRGAACPYADAPTARDAVERLLTYTASEFSRPCNPRGCLMVMAATTSSTSSPQLQAALAERRAASRARLKARIDRGVREGELPRGTNTATLADFYATILSGMSLQARDGASRRRLMATVESAMRAWPESPKRVAKRVMRERKSVAGPEN